MDVTVLRQCNQLQSEIRELDRVIEEFNHGCGGFFIQTDLIPEKILDAIKGAYKTALEEKLADAKKRFAAM